MTLKSFLEEASFRLRQAGSPSPRLDAELIAQHVLKMSRIDLIVKDQNPVLTEEKIEMNALLERRLEGEPVAYLTGKKEFYGFDFSVGSGVLVPRPETERLVAECLTAIQNIERPLCADLGAGTGCIGQSVLLENKNAKCVFIESSEVAFSFLLQNAKQHALVDRGTWIDSAVEFAHFEPVFDVIVSNPPYIAKEDKQLHPWVRRHEPPAALFSPEEGLKIPKDWLKLSVQWIKPGGTIIFEIGAHQGAQLQEWCATEITGFDVTLGKDLAGLDRYLKLVDTRVINTRE